MIRRHLAGIRRTLRGTTPDAEAAARVRPAPAVEWIPRQRTGTPMPVTEEEVDALIRVVACNHLGRDWDYADFLAIEAMHDRAKRTA